MQAQMLSHMLCFASCVFQCSVQTDIMHAVSHLRNLAAVSGVPAFRLCLAKQDPVPLLLQHSVVCLMQALLSDTSKQRLWKEAPEMYQQLKEREALAELVKGLNAREPEAQALFSKLQLVMQLCQHTSFAAEHSEADNHTSTCMHAFMHAISKLMWDYLFAFASSYCDCSDLPCSTVLAHQVRGKQLLLMHELRARRY